MIDPTKIINYDRTDAELEEFFLFCVLVAGKNLDVAAKTCNRLVNGVKSANPFFARTSIISALSVLKDESIERVLRAARTGQYSRLVKTIKQSSSLNLRTCSLEDLLKIHGVGRKSANFFLTYTRKDHDGSVLDVHILSFLRDHGIDAPKATPSSEKRYNQLSADWKRISEEVYPELTNEERDLKVWKAYSGR